MSAPTGVPGAPAGPPPIVGAGGVAQGATPQGFGATSVGTSPVMDQQAQAYSPGFGGRHRMGFHGGGLPPGIDPQAVAANPQGYQQWQQAKAMQSQGAAQPGMQGGMTDPNAGAPTGPPQATGLLGNAPPEVQQQLQQQGPQVPGGGAGPSDQAAQMMQAMAQAKALRSQPQQQAPGVGQQYESTGA